MKYRFILHSDVNGDPYISTIVEDTGSITLYPNDVRAVYIDEIDTAKLSFQAQGIDIQPILDYETENGL